MRGRGITMFLGGALLVISACSATVQSATESAGVTEPSAVESSPATLATPDTAIADDAPATSMPVATLPETTIAPTTTEPKPQIYDPACVVEVEALDSLGLIANAFDDETVNVVALRAENNLPTADIEVGQLLDVCTGNGLDDITGEQRADPDKAVVDAAVRQNVEIQQLKLNKLFEEIGTQPLLVDGVSGPVTRQRLCAARLAMGLEVNTTDMAAGSAEERMLLAADELPMPFTSALNQPRWILIDRTCQFMFVGEGAEQLVFGFPTSTGSEGYETRDQDQARAFRFDPAVDNGGWHDSSDFPVAADNPLNGNMYRPLYFDLGQAIHGANNVPTSPQSKGCARLRTSHQDQLVDWLGLASATTPTWSERTISVAVNVQGEYVGSM
ncbi:L,D-transpeptidase family protein [Ilumatobacter sp.]|uniref:L,D-transpeptidase family protein n=1 Tax=Ilumatobacter sp. TaxID=1967498 RepID=UPI0037522B06